MAASRWFSGKRVSIYYAPLHSRCAHESEKMSYDLILQTWRYWNERKYTTSFVPLINLKSFKTMKYGEEEIRVHFSTFTDHQDNERTIDKNFAVILGYSRKSMKELEALMKWLKYNHAYYKERERFVEYILLPIDSNEDEDIDTEPEVITEIDKRARRIAGSYNILYFEKGCCPKTGENIDYVFDYLVTAVMTSKYKDSKETTDFASIQTNNN